MNWTIVIYVVELCTYVIPNVYLYILFYSQAAFCQYFRESRRMSTRHRFLMVDSVDQSEAGFLNCPHTSFVWFALIESPLEAENSYCAFKIAEVRSVSFLQPQFNLMSHISSVYLSVKVYRVQM